MNARSDVFHGVGVRMAVGVARVKDEVLQIGCSRVGG